MFKRNNNNMIMTCRSFQFSMLLRLLIILFSSSLTTATTAAAAAAESLTTRSIQEENDDTIIQQYNSYPQLRYTLSYDQCHQGYFDYYSVFNNNNNSSNANSSNAIDGMNQILQSNLIMKTTQTSIYQHRHRHHLHRNSSRSILQQLLLPASLSSPSSSLLEFDSIQSQEQQQQQQKYLFKIQQEPSSSLVNNYCSPTIGVFAATDDTTTTSNHNDVDNNNHRFSIISQFTMNDWYVLPTTTSTPQQQKGNTIDELSLELWVRIPIVLNHKSLSSSSSHISRNIPIITIGKERSNTQNDINSINDALNICDEKNIDLQLLLTQQTQNRQQFQFIIRTSSSTSSIYEPCRIVSVDRNIIFENSYNNVTTTTTTTQLHHIVLSIQNQHQIVFINSIPIIEVYETLYISNDWHSEYRLFLFHYHDPIYSQRTQKSSSSSSPKLTNTDIISPRITIYQLTFYMTALIQENVQNLIFYHTIPSVQPVVYNQTIVSHEDSDIIIHISHNGDSNTTQMTPSSSLPIVDATNVNGLGIEYIDRDVQELIRFVYDTIISPTISQSIVLQQLPSLFPIYIYVTGLPHIGHLYYDDNSENHLKLLSSNQQSNVWISLGNDALTMHSLKYIPPHIMISYPKTLTSFTYCIATTMIFHIHQCLSMGSINIVVLPVNDPPIAFAIPSTMTVYDNGSIHPNNARVVDMDKISTRIHLTGSDIDIDDTIGLIQIVKLPQIGYLSLVVTSFRKDMLLHGARLNNYTTISNINPVYVRYIFDRNMININRNVVVQNQDVTDYFTFRVCDQYGAWSIEQRVEIQIISSLVAYANDLTIQMQEDSITELSWYGYDNGNSMNQSYFQFLIDKIPSSDVGALINTITNTTISKPGIISIHELQNMTNTLQLQFQSKLNFCHSSLLNISNDNVFQFRVMSLYSQNTSNDPTSTTTIIHSVSDPFVQRIVVKCKMDYIELIIPFNVTSKVTSIIVSSLKRTSSDPCHAIQWIQQYMHPQQTYHTTLTRTCKTAAIFNGITLSNIDHNTSMKLKVSITTKLGLLTFHPLYWNQSVEPLIGRSTLSSGTTIFLAYPDDVTNILSNLHYQSYNIGLDNIDFEIQYGDCTSINVTNVTITNSLRTTICQILRGSIPIEVLPDTESNESNHHWDAKFPWQVIFCLIGYPILYTCYVYIEMLITMRQSSNNIETTSSNNNNNNSSINDEDDEETIVFEYDEAQQQERHGDRYVQHEDMNGMLYYEDTYTGCTQWTMQNKEII